MRGERRLSEYDCGTTDYGIVNCCRLVVTEIGQLGTLHPTTASQWRKDGAIAHLGKLGSLYREYVVDEP